MKTFYTTTVNNTISKVLNRTFTINPRQHTPFVQFDGKAGHLTIKGNSTDLTISNQLVPLVTLVNEYLKDNEQLICTLLFKSFNTSTCKILFSLFRVLQQHKRNNKIITVNWFVEYEYDDMIETGLDFAGIFDLNFNVQYA